jgi:hypothetical protein
VRLFHARLILLNIHSSGTGVTVTLIYPNLHPVTEHWYLITSFVLNLWCIVLTLAHSLPSATSKRAPAKAVKSPSRAASKAKGEGKACSAGDKRKKKSFSEDEGSEQSDIER